ncbi:MAG: LamG-like jellyroll fold domain-containing protein [Opitutaceae bacterium]
MRPRLLLLALLALPAGLRAEFRAGTALVDVTPETLPVLVNGGMTSRTVGQVKSRLHARAFAFSDGRERLAIVVVDSCMLPRPLLDEAKALAAERTGIPRDRILISATHTHTAPSAMGCLGTDADPAYVPFVRERLAAAVVAAHAALVPARLGFARADAAAFTAVRRWIRRPDRVAEDPFGNPTVRANMHAARNWDDVTGESGPEDPELTLLSVQTRDGRPLGVLANFSMHYFGDSLLSADYFGLFCAALAAQVAPGGGFLPAMAHGCSGDIWRVDYRVPEKDRPKPTIEQYAADLAAVAARALAGVPHREDVTLAMAERRMTLAYRAPDQQRLEWARRIVAEMGDRLPKTQPEIYAREQIFLHERQRTEVVVQALRLGDIAIATTPCETYAVTGLKLKAASPLEKTMVIELANGGDGYIPPPEQHLFGGYNTWAARSAGLEVSAEPRIAQAGIELLEQVTGRPRRGWTLPAGPAAEVIRGTRPTAWWRLDEFTGPIAADASGGHRDAYFEAAVTFYLEGPHSGRFTAGGALNRAPHFVGGRLRARLPDLSPRHTVSLWIWNGMPAGAREIAGWFYSRDHDHGLSEAGEHLGLAGQGPHAGRLVFQRGPAAAARLAGRTVVPRWTWRHVALVRDAGTVRVYLDGELELEGAAEPGAVADTMFGGRSDHESNWEGRLDEIAVFPRALSVAEIRRLALR